MSHLICTEHARRVVVVNNKALHRSDRTECDSKNVKAGDVVIPVNAKVFDHVTIVN